jgi:hypothetical protein
MITVDTRGYLFIQEVEQFQKKRRKDLFGEYVEPSPLDGRKSYAGNGWYKITHSIPDGEFVKIAAERDGIRVEARFNMVTNKPDESNGSYQITGGLYKGAGTFLNIARKQRNDLDFLAKGEADFQDFFICHSHASGNGVPFLRWRIVLSEIRTEPLPVP